jgi:hypothetical protein
MINKERSRINKILGKYSLYKLSVDEFLKRVGSDADIPECVKSALEGIWCGTEGRMTECFDGKSTLVITWYNGMVEVAYIG